MSVLSRIQGFASRHKNKFLIGGAFISGSIILTKYAQYKFKEWQEKETSEFFDRNRKQNHFESIGRTTNQTLSNFSVSLLDLISEIINTDEVIENIKANPDKKVELWNSLKLLVFTKVSVTVYSIVMLAVVLNVQLTVIGGYMYKDPNRVPTDIQEKYLSLSEKFINLGIQKLAELIEYEMKKLVSGMELSKLLKLGDIESLFWSLQVSLSSLKDGPIEQFRKYIIPEENNSSDSVYDSMVRDTADLLESEEVKSLVTHCINQGFITLGDQLAELYSKSDMTTNGSGESFINPFELQKPLAKLIPLINGLLTKQSFPQVLIQQLNTNKKIQTFNANIYESLL
ncbi:peroxisomal biogenesis factor 3 [Diorhabda sublineata]|uniref:peroxisomal biogenesis factor 3 n=1 Tax=Diorhabda sublineata TaxID=1163346 RepID=UPI0024E109AB|nr:peroxisomal biogenesis factor 3 [Diorhabda sublineata]